MNEATNYVYIVLRNGNLESVNCSDRTTAVCVFDMDAYKGDKILEQAIKTMRQETTEIEYWGAEEIYGYHVGRRNTLCKEARK